MRQLNARSAPARISLRATALLLVVCPLDAFLSPGSFASPSTSRMQKVLKMSTMAAMIPTWSDLQARSQENVVGQALFRESELRKEGKGSAHVHNTLRKFDSESTPKITLYRDHAGWCPYCQKTMLLVEEKRVPLKISVVPMRSYGDKPNSFLQKVPNGLLPAIEVDGRTITESQVIMELLDQWHPPKEGYLAMLPDKDDTAGGAKFDKLARLERELFSWWCTLIFRPESGLGGAGNPLKKLMGGGSEEGVMSGAMKGFMDCIKKVDSALLSTKGPWFFGESDHPTMIDFVYVSHVERMLASCAFWKGLNLRDPKWNLKGLNAWLDAFEKREAYLAFKSDYYTHVLNIPPQYGPGYSGGFEEDRKAFSSSILGQDGSWHLPLSHDDPLQPLYRGQPLPLCVLEAGGVSPDDNGSYESADPEKMAAACRVMAAWKVAGNGENISAFAARGGPEGSQNPRKPFGAELADPYAQSDDKIRPAVDDVLRIVCAALMDDSDSPDSYADQLKSSVPKPQVPGVSSSLAYLRNRVGVPRDLPLASARYFRAYLSWAIDVIDGK